MYNDCDFELQGNSLLFSSCFSRESSKQQYFEAQKLTSRTETFYITKHLELRKPGV